MSDDLRPAPEESLEDLYENAPCGYLSSELDGAIVRVNATLCRWLGYCREELLGKLSFVDLLSVPGKVFHETHYAPLLHMQGSANEIAFDLVCKDGRRLPVLVSSVCKLGPDGAPRHVRTTVFNATDRRKYERELLLARRKAEQAAKAKADFLAMVSHEIRNPLHSILAVAQHLTEGTHRSQRERYLHILQAASESLLNLVNDVLDFSKLEAGKVALEERRFDVRELVYGVVGGLGVRADEKGLALVVKIDDRVPSLLCGDPIKIAQVLTNLVGNAIKFTRQGTVSVSLRVEELAVDAVAIVFAVSDTGIGIAQDRLSIIFEDYVQATARTELEYGGTGLGLSICRRLLELYGSTIDVQSELGRGSTFSFRLRLPIAPVATPGVGPLDEVTGPEVLRGMRVLVAEACEVDACALTRLLTRWGVEFELVATGEDAVRRVQQSSFDLVLMDLLLPQLDGSRAAQAIRQLPGDERKSVPIVALSSCAEVGQRERLQSSGFSDLVGKPFDADALCKSLMLHGTMQRALRTRNRGHAGPHHC